MWKETYGHYFSLSHLKTKSIQRLDVKFYSLSFVNLVKNDPNYWDRNIAFWNKKQDYYVSRRDFWIVFPLKKAKGFRSFSVPETELFKKLGHLSTMESPRLFEKR